MLGINVGVDLGTTSVIICVEGKGIVLSEPSVVARIAENDRILAFGKKAYDMIGKNPQSINVIRPMKDGVVSDFEATEQMLRYFLQKICANKIFKPNVIVCMPSSVTNLEKRTILDVVTASGAGRACLIEEPLAAAIGAGIDISHPYGTMVIDIGGGTTDVAVITMGTIAVSNSVRIAGNLFDEDILRYVRRERDILIGELTAENIKKQIGCAYLRDEEVAIIEKGKSRITGMPVHFEISSTEIFLALREHLEHLAESIRIVLEKTPPELVADIASQGIVLTGGGANLFGLDVLIERKTGISTRIADDSINCVIKGTGVALKHMEVLADNGYIFKTREEIVGTPENSESAE